MSLLPVFCRFLILDITAMLLRRANEKQREYFGDCT